LITYSWPNFIHLADKVGFKESDNKKTIFSPTLCNFRTFGGGGSSFHSGIEFGRSRTGEGSSGGEEEGGGTGDATIGFRQVDRRLQPQEGALD